MEWVREHTCALDVCCVFRYHRNDSAHPSAYVNVACYVEVLKLLVDASWITTSCLVLNCEGLIEY